MVFYDEAEARKLYERYKLQWMVYHGLGLVDLMDCINAPTDTLCFVEFNPNHEEDERVCIGAYRSNQDDPTYYAPYMAAERNANNE